MASIERDNEPTAHLLVKRPPSWFELLSVDAPDGSGIQLVAYVLALRKILNPEAGVLGGSR